MAQHFSESHWASIVPPPFPEKGSIEQHHKHLEELDAVQQKALRMIPHFRTAEEQARLDQALMAMSQSRIKAMHAIRDHKAATKPAIG